jgi:hypothetical protein
MLNVRNVRPWIRTRDLGRVIFLVGLVLTCLAACGPGSGHGLSY